MPRHSSGETSYGTAEADRGDGIVVSRRDALRLSGAVGAAAIGGFGTGVGSAQTEAWTVVVVPDTQKYARSSSLIAFAQDQTTWIANNLAVENIAFVTHEGDWVDDGSNRTEWQRMDDVWNTIEGDVPYAAAIGDHDYAVEEDRASGAANYREFFGEARYGGYSWFGGSAPNDRSHYQRFSAGGYDFLHIDLEWEAPGDPSDPTTPVGWAQSVLDANPETPAIITTHSYLWDEPGQEGRTTFVEENSGDGNSGQQLFRKLVEPNPQVFMTFNGNFHRGTGSDNGEWAQVSQNAAGLAVYELLANYQDYPNGGDGWLRLVRFVPGGGSGGQDRIEVRTYSPSLGAFQTDDRSQFGFDLRFADRFSVSSTGGGTGTETLTFQTGVDDYAGTVDTYLQQDQPGADNGSAPVLNVDTSDPSGTGQSVQALVRFDDIVGAGSGQVPGGATVTSATLAVETTDEGAGAALHRMLVGWSDGDSWDSLGNGVQADGSEAAATADTTTGTVSTGTTTIDVTDSVQRWVDGETNHGWAFLPLGGNGWDFYSAEGATPPTLTVTFESSSSGGSDGAPAVSWIQPSDGGTVGGTVSLRIAATDTEDGDDALAVEWRVDGGTWRAAAYDATSGEYEDVWDSTGVSDGTHTLEARATDSAGNTATATVTVTTENTDAAPSVSWVQPSDGATVDGSVAIGIDASDDRDGGAELTVEWQVDDGQWRTATYDAASGRYEDVWDTTGVTDGGHTLGAQATDASGNTSAESSRTVTVDNVTENTAPSITRFDLTDTSNPAWEWYSVDWAVSDPDGNLSQVTVEMRDAGGKALDTVRTSVTGTSASGSSEVRTKRNGAVVVVTVTDDAGGSASASRSI